ncbi:MULTISPECIES: choice-of-anchor D domain-containing protein [unclassified Corallococcus]|uniref:choice-of-anchor D domain-containing protein n=1 Tax=unclassified Corallococcus TaxID=2685029 RepID=UPI001A8E4B90|nr:MULTISPECIES: choice-of-anchor D domain-containing protein [unclassified Corallococcus]MBN9686067.1 choice-of-anchor D domain-containing protein [Corallococcus sp. NCSPR001]WAS82497.1 choice-of-anchor D domain-containing protein [Corallococcus sp. NCRR]
MQRILLILTASLCVLTACGPEAEKPPEPGTSKSTVGAALRPDDPVPSLELNDTSIDFDPQASCVPRENSLTLTNTGTEDRKIYRATITGGFTFNGVHGATGPGCNTNCNVPPTPANGTGAMTVRIGFSPTQPGSFHGTLTLYTDDPVAPTITVTLDGTATGSLLIVGQTSVVFGAQKVGTPSSPYSITIKNLGTDTFVGTPSTEAPFSVPSTPLTIPAGHTESVAVTFTPTLSGAAFGTLTLANISQCPAPPTVWLSGQGLSPAKLVLSSGTLGFPNTTVGDVSAEKEVTVTNSGDYPLTVTQPPLNSNSSFEVTPMGGDYTLSPGEPQILKVKFKPASAGAKSEDVLFTSNGESPQPKLTLSGTAVAAPLGKLVLSRTVMAFPQTPVGSASSQEVTLRNEGGSLLKVTALNLQPASSAFTADAALPFELTPGEIRQLKLTFTPATSGSASTRMSFTNTGSTVPTLDLSGATPPVVATKLVLNSTTIDFGTRDACASTEASVILRNQSGSNLNIQNASITGGFSLVGLYKTPTTACGFPCTVLPSTQANPNEVTVKVAFGQKQPGGFQGTLTLYTNDPDMPSLTVALSGTAEGPLLVFEQPVVDFGRQQVGTQSPQRQVKVLNLGNKTFSNTPSLTSPFSLTPGTLTIPAGQSGQLAVTFEPTSRIQSTGTLTLTNSSSTTLCPTPPTASLKGEGFQPATLALSRPTLTFAETSVGATSAAQEVTVRNDGDELLSVTQLALEKNLHFELNPSGSFSLAPGDTHLLRVSFKPTAAAAGLVSDTLTFAGAGTDAPKLSLKGTAKAVPPGELKLNRAQVAFPRTAVGNTSAAQEFTLTNAGGKPVTVSQLKFAQKLHFEVDTAGPFTLAPGQTQTMKVTFKPTAPGESLLDELAFETTDDPSAPKLEVSGSATPGTACIGIAPASFLFSDQAAGDPVGEQKLVKVTNTGTVAVTVTPQVTEGAPHYTVSSTAPFTLEPGSTGVDLFIKFKPLADASGNVDGTLTFNTSPATSQSCLTSVPLRGNARKTSLVVNPTSLDFGSWTVSDKPPTRLVTLKNSTKWPVKVNSVSAASLAPYTLTGIPSGGLTVEPNSTETLTVAFATTTWGESFARTLEFETDASEEVAPVSITGKALAPELTLKDNPDGTLLFENAAPGGERLAYANLYNTGNHPLFLSEIVPDSKTFFQVVDFLAQTVAPGEKTTVKLRFSPLTSVGDLQTQLRFYTTNKRELPPVLILKGNSNGPNAIFGASELKFGHSQINVTAVDEKSLSLRNELGASEALRVTSIKVLHFNSVFSVDPITSSEPVLSPGSTRTPAFKVSFRPTEVGTRYDDTLAIEYRGVTSGLVTTRTFPLSGFGADAELSSDEAKYNFPATLKDATSEHELIIRNTGLVDAYIESVTVSPSNGFLADVVGWPERLVKVGQQRKIILKFSPTTTTGSFSSTLSIRLRTTPVNATAVDVELTGVASIAKLELGRSQIDFGEVPRHTTKIQNVTLKNIGSARLTIFSIQATDIFTVQSLTDNGTFPIILEGNETESVAVKFRPVTALPVNATLKVMSDSDQSMELPISVSGVGTVPVMVLPGGVPKFAPQAIDVEGPTQRVPVRNDGKADLVISSITATGEFCLRPDPVPNPLPDCSTPLTGFTVKPSETGYFWISAKPTARDERTSNLIIASNIETSPLIMDLKVNGIGIVSLPTGVIFGPVNFGTYLDKEVTVQNSGITPVIVSVDFDAGVSEFTSLDQKLDVPAGSSAQLKLRFRPLGSTAGLRSAGARLVVQGGAQIPFTVEAIATSVRMAVTRTDGKAFDGTLDFGGTRVNANSDFINLRLTHVAPSGPASAGTDGGVGSDEGQLSIQDLAVEGVDSKFFVLQKPSKMPVVLGRNGSVDLPIQFHPDAQRNFNAVLRITSDDSQAKILSVTLLGRGRTNQLSLSTPALEFGARVAESSTSAIRSVRLTNESLQPLRVDGLEIIGASEHSEPSHFNVESGPALPFTLAAQESKEIFVKYVPRPDVTSKANLLVVTSDLESPEAQVSLSGRGLSTVFRALSRTVDFGTVRQAEPAATKVVLTNDTTQELVLMPPKVEGPQAANFVVVSPILGAEGRTLAQGDSLTLDLKYDTTVIGASKAALVLGTKDQERAALVALSGVSVASFLTIEPMELDLGWVDIGATSAPRTVTLTNQSASPARLSVVSNSNPAFEIDASALDAELAPGAQTTVGVTFRGEVGGPAEGTLKLRLRGETTTEAALTLKAQARTLGGQGGGCACGTSGDGGAALALLLLLGLGLARQTRRAQAED